jgi:molybdopterin-dependent oxidoreductase alpha subunit
MQAHFTGIRTGVPAKKAVGFPAIFSALGHAITWMKPGDAWRTMFSINQKGGFDCPGCAWPDPDDDRSGLGEYCENGLKAIAEEATKLRLRADFFQKNSIDELLLLSDYEIGKKGRLTEPMWLRPGSRHYEPITWEAAFRLIAEELRAAASPDEAVFYTSGRTGNEAAFLYQLFVRMYGTNNLPDCSNMCHESSGKGLSETIGIGKGTVKLSDFYEAELVIVAGQNPGTNHPRMLTALERCKENGGKIIAVNPLPEAGLLHFTNPQRVGRMLSGGIPLADLFLQVRINGDVALLKALMLALFDLEAQRPGTVIDQSFIEQKTKGFAEFAADLKQQNFDTLAAASGVEADQIREAAALIAAHKKMIICWAMGLTQHKNAVDNVREIVNLLLLRGSIGIPGAGVCPVRGHSNVQGDRTMGIWEAPKPEFLDKLQEVFHFEPPRHHGYDTVATIEAMRAGKVRVFFALGGNFLSATPDTTRTGEGLTNCRLTVQVSTKLNRSHLVPGRQALILPCLGRTEKDKQASGLQFVTVENSMGVVHRSQGVLEPCGPLLKSEVAIVTEMAEAVLNSSTSAPDWQALRDDYSHIRDLIEQVVPGFDSFNERVQNPAGFYLPNGPRHAFFETPDQKAHFTINDISDVRLETDEYLLMTIRSHDQFNTTIYGLHDRYRGIFNERRVLFMNEKDMEAAGLKPRQVVHLSSHYQNARREARYFLVIPYDLPSRCLAAYFPETNELIPYDEYARKSRTPISKSVVVKIEQDTGQTVSSGNAS